jgi:hypothetical protein
MASYQHTTWIGMTQASARGLIDISHAVDRLEHTTFRAEPALLKKLRELKKGKSGQE